MSPQTLARTRETARDEEEILGVLEQLDVTWNAGVMICRPGDSAGAHPGSIVRYRRESLRSSAGSGTSSTGQASASTDIVEIRAE
jgi:hypothetical protein